MGDHRRLSNSEFRDLLNDIFTKADGNAATYGLTQDLVDEAQTRHDAIVGKINGQVAKKAEAKASTTALNLERKTGNDFVSHLKIQMRAAEVAPEKFVEIGFDEDDLVPSPIAVFTPSELVVNGFSNGTNALNFNRNGNQPHTIFSIEAKIGDAADYVIVGTTTKTNFKHLNQTPGVKVTYRVRALRGEVFSEYSNTAVVYG